MKITNPYQKLGADFYKEQLPEKIREPDLVLFNEDLAHEIDFDFRGKNLAEIFCGNELIEGSKPVALAYSGHQFGNFVPVLGDGRAVLLAQIENKNNEFFDIALKGSGRGFFSRGGDGKCPLDAAIREYAISEAMHYLGIATTRSLALVKSDEYIQRNILAPSSVITRIAKSHIRIGTFQYFACRNDLKNLEVLANYAIDLHFPKIKNSKNKYLDLLDAVAKSQADLVSSWMCVGFIHGVMNTDNTAISGQTLDYGPCAFMDQYRKDQCFSYIDKMGRYNFSNQRNIILWNLTRFAESILPLIDKNLDNAVSCAQKTLGDFDELFDDLYFTKMAKKIGIFDFENAPEDKKLIEDFLVILEENKIDFTNGFRILSKILLGENEFFICDQEWKNRWVLRLKKQKITDQEIAKKMDETNPALIPRNHIIEEIIQKSVFENNHSQLKEFIELSKNPFTKNEKFARYYLPPKENERVKNTFCGT